MNRWGQGRGGRPWRRLRERVLVRDNYTCQACGKIGPNLEVDHKVSKAKGGSDAMDNLQALCVSCHARKTRQDAGHAKQRTACDADGWPIGAAHPWNT